MASILLFGGLTYWGSLLTDRLLVEGHEVTVPYYKVDEGAVKRSLLFGRNALFSERVISDQCSTDWVEQGLTPDVLLLFDGLQPEDSDLTLANFTKCIIDLESIEKVIVLSHIDIYGLSEGTVDEQAPLAPETPLGKQARHIETVVKQTVENTARLKQVVILRIPSLYEGLELDCQTAVDCLHICDLIEAIHHAIGACFDSGVHVIQLTSGEWLGASGSKVCYSYKKAEQLLGFNPEYTRKK